VANASALATFRDWVELSVANATGLPGTAINLTAVRKGSVVAEVDVWVPRSYTPTQLAAIKTSLANATTVFDPAGAPGLASMGPAMGRDPASGVDFAPVPPIMAPVASPPPTRNGAAGTTASVAAGAAAMALAVLLMA